MAETLFGDYRDLVFPSFLLERAFEDFSYHNDAMACAARPLRQPGDAVNAESLQIWVAEDRPADRESAEIPKFILSYCPNGTGDQTQWLELWSGESADACEAVIDAFLGYDRHGKPTTSTVGTPIDWEASPRPEEIKSWQDARRFFRTLYYQTGAIQHPDDSAASVTSARGDVYHPDDYARVDASIAAIKALPDHEETTLYALIRITEGWRGVDE